MAQKKMYYSEEEAANRLGKTIEELTDLARQGELQQYQDGAKKVYRADQIDQFASPTILEDTGEIELAPADSTISDSMSLSETDAPLDETSSKEDTVITAEGISIFDDEDLEIDTADPMAKTQIAPSLEDQISMEGVGSGSGLLDLTRESDDTSLGAEVLDHIDMESGVVPSLEAEVEQATSFMAEPEAAPAVERVVLVEAADPGSGLFSGFTIGSTLVAMVLAAVMMCAMTDRSFTFVEVLKNNMGLAVGGAAGLVIVCGVVGLVLGKSSAARQGAG